MMKTMSTLLLLLLTIVTYPRLYLCNSKQNQLSYDDNIDPEDLTYFFSSNTRTWQHFLEDVTFPTREHCANVMCAPRQQSHYPYKWTGFGSVARDMWRPLGPVEPEFGSGNSLSDPKVLLEDIRQGMGPGSDFIYDDMGRVIGILPPEGPQGSTPDRPTTMEPAGSTEENRPEQPPPNVDICCQTREAFFINTTLTDIFGVTRTIAQYSVVGSYQFIRHGICGSSGSCEGVCVPELITIPLAIHPTASNQLVTFSFFKIPGYCTCKVAFNQGR